MAKKFKSYRAQKKFGLFTLSLPGLLFVFVFAYLPMAGLVLAFKRLQYDLGIFGSPWVGFSNFEFFFKSDVAWRLISNTILYSASFMVITTIASLVLAILLNELTRRWVKFHQTILFLPYFLSWVIVAYLVEGFLDHNRGFINNIFLTFGWDTVRWYAESSFWPYILNIVSLWKGIGFGALIYYAGIMGIDPSLYEAAKMDGANRWKMAKHITLPLLSSLISIMIIISIGGMMTVDFGLFYFVPKDSTFLYSTTDVINTYVYRSLIDLGDIGMSTAVGLFQSFVGLILVFGSNYVIKRMNEENSLW